MTSLTIDQLAQFGPERCDALSVDEARALCRRLATGRYENFSVLSAVVPPALRDDFAAVYAFCRWADDLGDETGDAARALELLDWWRRELTSCFDGSPRHPVFVALAPTVRKHDLPFDLFERLIRAFEQDQSLRRYDTWDQLIDYCRKSADPVGRLVLMVLGEPRTADRFEASDAICTALQLTNHWQDIRRDVIERDRIYLPRDMIRIDDFDRRLADTAREGHAPDREFFGAARELVRSCVARTWPLYERGESLLQLVGPGARPVVWLLAAGGQQVLRQIELWNYETALHRPRLGRMRRASLVWRAWRMARTARRGGART